LLRIFTNGLTMTPELARALAGLAVHVVEISLYSHRAEVHDFVTGVPGSFEKSTNGVRYLVAEGVSTHVKTNVTTLNEHDIDAYIAFANELGASYAFDVERLMASEGRERAPQMWDRGDDTYRSMLGDPRFVTKPLTRREGRKPDDATLCGAGDYLLVEPNGELRPCTMLDVGFGNAATEGVRALQRDNATFRELTALRWRDAHGCRTCDLNVYCNRCHASALAEVGDALGPYPSGCERARIRYELAHGQPLQIRASAERPAERPALGPYRRVAEHSAEHVFEAVPDVVTAEDDALAARLGWVRRAHHGLPEVPRAHPGELVQLRRPGRKQARAVRVPEQSLDARART
jgi:radical SAM protein with 4Fe4S-binding SPASM domain